MNKEPLTRQQAIAQIDPKQPKYRLDQIKVGLFNPHYNSWEDITTITASLRAQLIKNLPWMSLQSNSVASSTNKETHKALLTTVDKLVIESVLMKNRRGQWTLCLSSQIGCAMKCAFCATGTMGLKRSLNTDEIVDQYRFWQKYVTEHYPNQSRISNIVIMGMGEPLANYDNVKEALQTILKHTDIGVTKITVSSVGILNQLNRLLDDPDWPPVRIAISLHAPNQELRSNIVPSTPPNFFEKLTEWAHAYLEKFGNRNHHLTFEYIMLDGINDKMENARQLAKYANSIGHVKVNLIPYNATDSVFEQSRQENMEAFKSVLEDKGVTTSLRKSMGDDISAACGQLVTLGK